MHSFTNLNTEEALSVLAAIYAVVPTGGGSYIHTLFLKMAQEAGLDTTSDMFQQKLFEYTNNVIEGAVECGAVVRT